MELGIPELDRLFVIKGDHPRRIQELFAEQRIQKLIVQQPNFFLEIRDYEGRFGPKFPEGVDELLFQVTGILQDVERLKSLYELSSLVLQDSQFRLESYMATRATTTNSVRGKQLVILGRDFKRKTL